MRVETRSGEPHAHVQDGTCDQQHRYIPVTASKFHERFWAPCKAPQMLYFYRFSYSAYVFWAPCKAPKSAREICHAILTGFQALKCEFSPSQMLSSVSTPANNAPASDLNRLDSRYFYPYHRVFGRLARRPKLFYYWAPCKAPKKLASRKH